MEYIYAALLLHKLGKDVSEDTVKSVVAATGETVDDAKVKSLIASLKDVDIENELANASAVSPSPGASAPVEAKAEEKPKEEKKVAAAEGLSALFG